MLIDFSFGNFRSFRDTATLSMVASNIKSQDKNIDKNNVFHIDDRLRLLTSAAVYGANASGKSNLVSAFRFMQQMVLNSSRESQAGEPIDISPFLLSTTTEEQPSFFEVNFIDNAVKYRYGFEVTRQKIIREWLFRKSTIREGELFTREEDQISVNLRNFKEGKSLEEKTRHNALFLSVVAQFNGKLSWSIQEWFRTLRLVSGLDDVDYRGFTVSSYMNNEQRRKEILEFVRSLDLFIDNIHVKRVENSNAQFPKGIPEEIKSWVLNLPGEFISFQTDHKKYDENGKEVGIVRFNLDEEESAGTQKIFSLSGPVIDALTNGKILIVDEMEARMHPLITCAIIQFFNSRITNPKHAQLIFTTHDTNLLDRSMMRRDQIWFTEKDHMGASHLYSLVEFKPRNDASFEKDYLRGKYGAIPYLGNIQWIFKDVTSTKVENDEE